MLLWVGLGRLQTAKPVIILVHLVSVTPSWAATRSPPTVCGHPFRRRTHATAPMPSSVGRRALTVHVQGTGEQESSSSARCSPARRRILSLPLLDAADSRGSSVPDPSALLRLKVAGSCVSIFASPPVAGSNLTRFSIAHLCCFLYEPFIQLTSQNEIVRNSRSQKLSHDECAAAMCSDFADSRRLAVRSLRSRGASPAPRMRPSER